MNIVNYISLSNIGGAERAFIDYISQSTDRPTENSVYLSNPAVVDSFRKSIFNYNIKTFDWSQFSYIGPFRLSGMLRFMRYKRAANKVNNVCSPEVLLAWNAFADKNLIKLQRGLRVPLIYYEHGWAWSWANKINSNQEDRLSIANKFLVSTSGVICNSYASVRMLQMVWSYTGKYSVIHCPLSSEFIKTPSLKNKIKLTGKRIRLGVACRLVSMKGVDIAILAVKE
jgi:glycosyltransferase involved in cell wall biosynthesis